MSGAVTAAAVVAATAYTVYSGERQADAQKDAQRQAEEQAKKAEANAAKQAKQAEQEMNRNRVNRPDASGIMDQVAQNSRSGASSTMLTGAQGVDPSTLRLGKNTLLGS